MAFTLTAARISHNFSQGLGGAVDLGERLAALLQVLIARVDVGLHRERRVIVTRPLADDRDRDSCAVDPGDLCQPRGPDGEGQAEGQAR